MNKFLKVSAILFFIITGGLMVLNAQNLSPYGKLSDEEQKVIVKKGTELPFSGKYDDFFESGVYACRQCGKPLYVSDDKFDSRCGWPSFDDAVPDAVKQIPDADGRRIEILCNACSAHLGHVFSGEKLTAKDTRHCVNSISLVFEPQSSKRIQRAVFAGGCFWGVEELMRKQKGVIDVISGYTGGTKANPSYQEVCSGKTGHAEGVEVFFDPSQTSFANLCRYFLEIHDPTQKDRQGPDVGSQYRSEIFYLDNAQRDEAEKLLGLLRKKGYDIQTKVTPFERFWSAERYHQNYYQNNGQAPYCHAYKSRF